MYKQVFKKFVLIVFFLSCNQNNSPVIEIIDNEKITLERFEQDYEIALETFSRQNNIEKKTLEEIINKDPKELPKEMQSIHYQFQKNNFYENFYRDMIIRAKAAEKSGFTSRPEIKRMLEFMRLQYISQIYFLEEFEKRFKVTDDEVRSECEQLRKNNVQLASRPISDCLNYARASLKMKYIEENQVKIRERIKEGISIKRNESFDLEEYLKNQKQAKPEESSAPKEPK